MDSTISLSDDIAQEEVLALYKANRWSLAEKPGPLLAALRNSHSLVTARVAKNLVGIGNTISDGHLVVYFPHLLVHPAFQRQGIGRQMMEALLVRYQDLHQLMLVADGRAVEFYRSLGFERAGQPEAMWVYAGHEH